MVTNLHYIENKCTSCLYLRYAGPSSQACSADLDTAIEEHNRVLHASARSEESLKGRILALEQELSILGEVRATLILSNFSLAGMI